jgi:two-component system, OmpR family, phosphate regulon sensor histidine kinase PhoR
MRVSPRVLAVVLLPAVVVLALGLPLLWSSLEGVAERVATDYLTVTLSVVTPMVRERLDDSGPELQRWTREIAGAEALRLTIIGGDGVVLADSSRTWEQVGRMDNHGTRPEVLEAGRTGRGAAVRRSATLGEDFVYVAELLYRPGGGRYFIRLSEPLSAVAAVTERMTGIIWAVLLVSLATIGAVTAWLNLHLFRPLSELATGADRMARGDLAERIHITADEALERVGGSLNRLAHRVEEQVAAVEAERSHLEVVGASMSEGILVTDAGGKAQLVNPSFRKLFRVKGDVTGRSAAELTLLPEIDDMIQGTLASGETRSRQLDILLPRRRWVAVTSSVLQDATGVVVAARDISDVVHLGQARRDLVANVSHELKTPLAAIRGYAETLHDGALDDPDANMRFVERILQQCHRLQALLDDLLTLSRLESFEGRKDLESVDLGEVLRETIDVLATVARDKEVQVSLGVEDSLRLDGNRAALDELFLNLVDNAIKYNRRGGEVQVRVRRDGERAVTEVLDTGRGIPESAIPRLFERFYRVDRGRARQEGGTGLGLAIVKHAVKMHGGAITVESELGQGTTFRVELPLQQG